MPSFLPLSPQNRARLLFFLSLSQVSRGSDFLYLTRGLTKKIRVNKSELVVTWGNLELAFANTEELGIFVSALKYVDFAEDNNTSSSGVSCGVT